MPKWDHHLAGTLLTESTRNWKRLNDFIINAIAQKSQVALVIDDYTTFHNIRRPSTSQTCNPKSMCTILVKFFGTSLQCQPVLQLSTTLSKVCTSFFLHLVTGLHNSTLLSHRYNRTKVRQIIYRSIPPQSFSTAAADHSYTMSYHSNLKKRTKLISLPFFLYCHVFDLSTFHSMARKHYLMNLETFLNLSTLNCFQRANLLRTLSQLLKVVYGGWPDIREKLFACKDKVSNHSESFG